MGMYLHINSLMLNFRALHHVWLNGIYHGNFVYAEMGLGDWTSVQCLQPQLWAMILKGFYGKYVVQNVGFYCVFVAFADKTY